MPAAHTDGMARACGAITTVVNQATTFVNGRLWAVEGDPNSHGAGALIATGISVFIEGKKVIVNSPDNASADGLCPIPGGLHCVPATAQGSLINFAYGSGGAGPPIEEPQPGIINLYAADLVVGSPQLEMPQLGGPGILLPANLVVGSPVLNTPTLTPNVNALVAAALVVSSPQIASTEMGGPGALLPGSLVVSAPVLGVAVMQGGGTNALTAVALQVSAPVLTTATLVGVQEIASVLGAFAIGSQVIGGGGGAVEEEPGAGIDHLYAAGLAVISPILTQSPLSTAYTFAGVALAVSSPAIGISQIGGEGILIASDFIVASPQLESPALAVNEYTLVAVALQTSAPELASAAIVVAAQEIASVLGAFAIGSQVIGGGGGAIEEEPEEGVDHLYAVNFVAGSPELSQSQLGTSYAIVASALQIGSPALAAPPLGGTGILIGDDLTIGSPQLESSVLVSKHGLTAAALQVSAPELAVAIIGGEEEITPSDHRQWQAGYV